MLLGLTGTGRLANRITGWSVLCQDLEPQQVIFELPERVEAVSAIRLYPMDTKNIKQIGFFSLSGIELIEVGEKTERTRWALHGTRTIQKNSPKQTCCI